MPRSPAPRKPPALNATKHGLLTREVLLPGEDPQALDDLVTRLHHQLAPDGVLEAILVDRIAACYWRLARAQRVEIDAMLSAYAETLNDRKEFIPRSTRVRRARANVLFNKKVESIVERYEGAIESRLYRALHELQTLQASRITGIPITPGMLHISLPSSALRLRPIDPPALPNPPQDL